MKEHVSKIVTSVIGKCMALRKFIAGSTHHGGCLSILVPHVTLIFLEVLDTQTTIGIEVPRLV
jgi:hypothetical protein